MTTIGIIGAGGIATAIAARVAAAGEDRVTLSNSRGPESLRELVHDLGASVSAGTVAEAGEADVVIVAVPWSHVPAALKGVGQWAGKILIDTTNPIEAPAFEVAELGGRTSSEVVASHAPGARVVKALNTYSPTLLASDPNTDGGRRVVFYSGDDHAAKSAVRALIESLGFSGVDLGGLVDGGALHQFPGGPLPGRDFIER